MAEISSAKADEEVFRAAVAEDLCTWSRLHATELTTAEIRLLMEQGFPASLALRPADHAGQEAVGRLQQALAELSSVLDGDAQPQPLVLDLLAADYAAIYLHGGHGASPYESVWVTEDKVTCQQPMFELRTLYASQGWRVPDWRLRHDDHLVYQLDYLAKALTQGQSWSELARFVDEHLGFWLPRFAQQVSLKADTPFYAALAVATLAWLTHWRQVLTGLGAPAPEAHEVIEARLRSRYAAATPKAGDFSYQAPAGCGPSW